VELQQMDYRAEAFDQIQFLFDSTGFNDHQLHCVLKFDHGLNDDVLERAVIASIEAIPVLGTRYIAGARPRWTSLDHKDLGRAFIIALDEKELEDFVVSPVDESLGPQVRVCLLNSMPFTIALKMNHMVCDGADFKAYLYFLCRTYSRMTVDHAYRPASITGDRSLSGVLNKFGLRHRFKSLLVQWNENNLPGDARFPLSDDNEVRPFILTRKLARKRTGTLKYCGQTKGATLNDVVLTAYYRCLFQRLGLTPGAKLHIPVMVDMRRYIERSRKLKYLTNLSSTTSTQLEYRPDEHFDGTLYRVKSIMDWRKGSNLGLNAFIKVDFIYRVLGDRIANRISRSMLRNPLICMTNMGILDAAQMVLGDLRPQDAFMCGSIKYKPHFQLAISSYDGELTLSVNLLGSADDRDCILSFLAEIDAELSCWESSQRALPRTEMHPLETLCQ
jgi:NRPS condensation-like uncharacterized protein